MLPNNEFNISETDPSRIPGLTPENDYILNNQPQLLSSAETLPEEEILRFSSSVVNDEIEINNIDGTRGRDNLVGTEGNDIITGYQGGDTLTGGDGSDTFVYTSTRDPRDIITDFEICNDIIDLSDVLDAIGFTGDDPIASGHVGWRTDGTDAIITIDPDGTDGTATGVSFITLQELATEAVENENFLTEVLNGCSETDPPTISAELLNDTGLDDSDRITSDPTIIGTVTDDSEIVSLTAGFNDTLPEEFVDITDALNESGNFELDRELLEEILGETLTNETYLLKLQATDDEGNLSEVIELEFTLDLDVEIPTISAELLNDTGLDNSDRITSDPTIIGTVTDDSEIVNFKAGLNDTPVEEFVDITAEVSESGSFELNQQLLEDILGETLTNDTYTLKLQATDEQENSSEILELEFTLDTEAPEIQAELLNDTGTDETDKITSDPTIIGTITENNDISSLVVSFNQQNLEYEIKDNLDSTGKFELTKQLLEEIKGEELEDGTHTLYFQAIDNADNTSEIFEYSFTLDTTTELTIELDSEFDTPPTGDNITEKETVTLSGQTEPNQKVTLAETGENVTADEEGKFEFVEVELSIGENTFNATVEDDAGNQETAEITITRDEIILIEKDNFNPTKIKTIEIPETSSQLNINIADIAFDTTDNNNINDAFELSLIDENGKSLVHTIKSERDSFFNLTEGETPILAAGVEFDGETITLNLSQLTPNTEATLQARLINNDSDTETTVRIREITVAATSSTTPPINTPDSPDSTATEIDFDRLSDVSGMVATEYLQTSFNDENNILYVDLTTESATENPLRGTLLLGIRNLSDPSIRVIDADGTTPEGLPYYNLTDSRAETVAFYNPQGVQFDYELVFLGELNVAPEFASDANVEAIVGRSYIYEALATDADGDELSFSLLESPVGMSIDAETGEIVWSPTTEDVGTHGVRVRVEDELGAFAEQNYVLSVVEGQPNRSPVWGSLPVVDASVNGDYVYEARATDADGDVLSFSLVESPEGMEVDGETGVVSWVPDGEQVGLRDVVLRVSDGNGGEAVQEFEIFVRQEEGNRSPIIVSEAETKLLWEPNSDTGKILLAGDEWYFSDTGISQAPTSANIMKNLASWITGGGSRKFHAYSNNFGVTGTSLAETMEEAGHTWTTGLDINFDLETLLTYDAIFIAGNNADQQVLTDYVNSGGNVVLLAATGQYDWWNTFLNNFGLNLANNYDGKLDRTTPIEDVIHPLLEGVDNVYHSNSQAVTLLDPNNKTTEIIASDPFGQGLLAIYDPGLELAVEYQYPVEAIDPDDDTLVYSLETAPDGMTIDPNTGEIIWNPTTEELLQLTESSSEPMIFFGEDISNLGDSSRLPATPNADDARDTFLSKLVGVETEDFESFADGETPENLTFGSDTADFLGNPNVKYVSDGGTYNGTFPTSGDKFLLQEPRVGPFEIEFSHPQAAFGFYATDVGDASSKLVVELYHPDGEVTEIEAPQALTTTPTGSALYFGVIDVENPFTKVKLTNTTGGEGFGFDDMTIGRAEQVNISPFDVTVKVSDGRGGVDTQSFQIEVTEPLGKIEGTVWNDLSGEGDRDLSETGLSGVEVYLDLNENGELDTDEPTTLTNSEGEYQFNNLTAGTYVVREVLTSEWEYTFPAATSLPGPNLLQNGSFEEGPNISQNFDIIGSGSTAIPNWNVTSGQVDYTHNSYIQASDGDISIDLIGISPGSLSQTFDTVPGKDYLVTFDLSANPSIAAGVGTTMEVKTADQSAIFVGVSTGDFQNMEYQTQSWEFTANSDSTTLELLAKTGLPARGSYIDNVSVSEILPDVKQVVSLGAGQTVKDIDFGNSKSNSTAPNSPPTFTSTNTSNTAPVGELWSYQATATDLDRDPLTYFLIAAPDGMTIDPDTGAVVWRPTPKQIDETLVDLYSFDTFGGAQPGVYDIVIGVKDNLSGIDVQEFEVEVLPTDKPVIVAENTIAPAIVGLPYQYRFRAQSIDSSDLTFRLDTTLEGMSLDETTGVLTWTPTNSQLGEQLVTVAVIDENTGVETTRDFNFSVVATAPNSPPTITSTPRQTVRIGDSYLYNIDATDPNNDPLTYTLETAPDGMTITENGRISWQPTAADSGINNISITVSDGRGGIAQQQYQLNVTTTGNNQPPLIESTPPLAATIGQQYEYNLTGSDPDSDEFWWSLDTAPQGMSIDAETGTIRWQPTASQIGSQDIAVRVTDARGAFVGQAFSVSVRGVNVPPVITSTPLTVAAIDKNYNYVVEAEDVEGDRLTFSLAEAPSGTSINEDTGEITWIPSTAGNYDVEVVVEDALGAVARQTYQIVVSETAANLPPTITSSPVSFGTIGVQYEYDVTAADPEGGAVTYQLLEAPDDTMTVDPETGLIEWMPTAEGVYTVTVGAVDAFGLGGAQRFTLDVAEAVTPVVASTPVTDVTVGEVYRYQILASSPRGERINYTLEEAPEGMTVDEYGRVVWMPDSSDVGSYEVVITMTDPRGNSVSQSFELTVELDIEAPLVNLFVSSESVGVNDTVNFVVNAVDNVGVESYELTIDGEAVAIDSNGLATVVMDDAGNVEVVATATDAAGNVGSATRFVDVFGGVSDGTVPVAMLDDAISDDLITAPVDVLGTVTDDGDVEYVLEVAPVAGGEFVEIGRGDTAVDGGQLGIFDPSLLQNDSYVLRLTATDAGGNSSRDEVVVDVAGELKLGNFRLSFTDLEIPVSGIPITVTRTYDSLNANERDDFGYGWRLEFRDTDLRTSVRERTAEEELLGVNSPFASGERVYVTLPGGERTGFTFEPRSSHLNGWLRDPNAFMYHPEFVADDGSDLVLRVRDANLVRKAGTNEFVQNGSGVAYNPADARFGGVYELVTKQGVVYEIDAVSGDLLTVTDRNGNLLTYSDGGIVSSTGVEVSFERDAAGRIVGVVDPEGNRIGYEYDGNGDLIGVTDREDNTTEFVYDADGRPHYLEEIVDPLGRSGVRTEYDEQGRLKEILDVNGEAIQLEYFPEQSKHTVKDILGNSTTYIYDERGNIVTEIDAEGGITQRTYDNDNNLKSETDPDGVITKYTYDSKGNILTLEDGDGNITRMNYNQYGQPLSIVSPTGLSMSFKYDSRGNLTESTDTDGLTTTYEYDSTGKPTRQVAPDGQVTQWEYDNTGNPTKMTDSRGNEVQASYDNNGRMQNATMDFVIDGQTYTLSRSLTYDKEGRTLSTTNSQGNTQSQTYNKLGQVDSTTDILGNVTLYDYNDKGLLRKVTLPDYTLNDKDDNPQIIREYDAADRLIKETSPTGLVTEYIYDKLGRTIETILPDLTPNDKDDNPRIQTEYTKAGRVAGQTDIFGNWASFDYDNQGRLSKETDILGNDTTYTYTAGGKIASIIDPRLRTTNFIYDDKARLTQVAFFDNTNIQLTYDALGRIATETNELGQITTYEYDPYSRVNAIIDPLNQRTELEYDTRGNLLKLTDALGKITRYEYDQYGRQTAIVFDNGDRAEMGYDNFNRQTTAKDENENVTKYEYDNFNRLTAIELANNARTDYSYDNLGQLTEIKDALKHSTQFTYDDFGRVVTTTLPLGQQDLNVFNNFGFLSSYTDFNGDTINYNYDSFGRLQDKTFSNADIAPVAYTYDPVTSQIVTVTDGRGVTSYDYDLRDRLSEITNPDGKSISYGYDVLNNITSLTTEAGTVEYVYDALSRLDKVKDDSEILADYDYDAVGNLVQTTRADGTVETRGYDDRHRLTDIETQNLVGQVMSSFSYTLDGAGNRTQVVEDGGRTVDYVYDQVNRLVREKIGDQTIDYTYDFVGNRLTRNDSVDGLTNYSYDANDRLIELLSANGVTTQFTYDDNGSMLSRANGIETVSYDWINDGENRLVGATIDGVNGLSSVEYVYDAEGNRVRSVVDGVETNYLVTPGGLSDVLLEYDADGAVTKDFVYGLGLVRSSENGSDSFFHSDGLGSVRMLTDTTGLVSDEFVYDAYGVLLSGDDGGYQFAGERRDGETGLDYLRARYYDPELGRFISKDAFSGFMADPMSMHDYQYAHANPVNNTDPTGYFTLQEASATVGLLGSLASLSTSIGYVGGAYLSGDSPSGKDLLNMADQWVAGFAHFASFGMSTGIRTSLYGETATQNHSGFLWNMGNLAGAGMSMLMGAKVPDTLSFKMGSSDWLATIYEGVSWGTSAWQTGSNIREGQLQWTDTFNLLPFASYGMSSQGVKAFLGTAQAIDGELRDWGQMAVTANFRSRKMGFTSETGAIVFPGTNPPEDVITLWRGVDQNHPGYPDAQKGIARPRGGHSDPEMHNMGDTDSVFTSWTTSERQAEYFATKYTDEGIVLEKEFEVPSKRVYESPDDHNEKEVLIRGLVTDAKVRNFNRSEWY